MEYTLPTKKGFTIYSKSGCKFCVMVKDLLTKNDQPFTVIDCDEYLVENRGNFLLFIKSYAKKDIGGFPAVFNDEQFIGGYNETKDLIDKLLFFVEDDF